jgi:hypothetical protein
MKIRIDFAIKIGWILDIIILQLDMNLTKYGSNSVTLMSKLAVF